METVTDIDLIDIVKAKDTFLEEEVGLFQGSSFGVSNRDKYAFRLSPDVLELTMEQMAELDEINDLMFGEGGFLEGSLRLFSRALNDLRFASTNTGSRVIRTLSLGIPKMEKGIQRTFQTQVPAVVRLDLALAQKTIPDDPSFKIMEVEGDKTHAFGYVTMIDIFGRQMGFEGQRPQGLISAFQEILRQRGVDPDKPLALIIGTSERFYERELRIFSFLAQDEGLNIRPIPEINVSVEPDGIRGSLVFKTPVTDLLVNLPILTPEGRFGTGIFATCLLDLYADARVQCLIPPKRFLGNKGLLGLVSNGDNDPDLEAVLLDSFSAQKLKSLRRFIPSTTVIGKRNRDFIRSKVEDDLDSFVVKKTVSSGMKGVALPSAKERQQVLLQEAFTNPFSFILQEKIEQETRDFNFAEPGVLDDIKRARMFMRISLFASEVGVAAVGVTARETPDVHGAKDSIQIPAIFI